MVEIDWVQAAVEAPLAAVLALVLYKCYRARVRLSVDSPCSKCCGWKLRLDMPGAASENARATSDESEAQTPKNEGNRRENVVEQLAAWNAAPEGHFPTAEARLEERPPNSDRLEAKRCDPREIVCCGGFEAHLANR